MFSGQRPSEVQARTEMVLVQAQLSHWQLSSISHPPTTFDTPFSSHHHQTFLASFTVKVPPGAACLQSSRMNILEEIRKSDCAKRLSERMARVHRSGTSNLTLGQTLLCNDDHALSKYVSTPYDSYLIYQTVGRLRIYLTRPPTSNPRRPCSTESSTDLVAQKLLPHSLAQWK